MSKKLDISRVKSACNGFIADNRDLIGGLVGTILVAKVCKYFNIPIGGGFKFPTGGLTDSMGTRSILINIGAPATAMQNAIYSIYKSTTSLSDYYKSCEAERIYDILSESKDPVDDATKAYAIQALTGIQESMSSSYYKSCVGDVIENILKI